MGGQVSRNDFEWSYTDEPHATRRKEILAKYPEIKKLFGYDANLKWIVLGMVMTQIVLCRFVVGKSWWLIVPLAYCIGGVINHSLMLAVHEIAHGLAFGHSRPLANRCLGIFANLPIGLPMSVTFKHYHLMHHRYQGDEILDTDLPTALEAKLFCTTGGKLIWLLMQPLFYALRPLVVCPRKPTRWETANTIVQLMFDWIVATALGWDALLYLLIGSLLSMGIHPVAGHFISEHYMFRKGYETYSYYGPLNFITFNVGYHNEHHDLPAVPGSRLPLVKKMAEEFYRDLPHHDSWTSVLYQFVTDPDIGPYARVKRKQRFTITDKEVISKTSDQT